MGVQRCGCLQGCVQRGGYPEASVYKEVGVKREDVQGDGCTDR